MSPVDQLGGIGNGSIALYRQSRQPEQAPLEVYISALGRFVKSLTLYAYFYILMHKGDRL
jgi:hypothetical protein